MTRSKLVERFVGRTTGFTRSEAEIIVDTVFESMQSALIKGGKVEIRGFGNFRLKTRNPRQARNPKTGEIVQVPAKKILYFKVGKELKEMLNPLSLRNS